MTIGLSDEVVSRCFAGTASQVRGADFGALAEEAHERHARGLGQLRKLVQLSGSGICYSSPDALPVGDKLLLEFQLPEAMPRHIRAVARVASCSGESEKGYDVAFAFEVIDASDRDAIIRYALRLQRRERRTGEGPS